MVRYAMPTFANLRNRTVFAMTLSFNWLVCLFFGHKEVNVTLSLGKIVPENVEAIRRERCKRIIVPVSQITKGRENQER